MIGPVVLVAVIALAVVAVVGWPLVHPSREGDLVPSTPAADQQLHDDLERTLRAIREIEADHRAGNLTDEDFAELDRVERARAAELIRRRDASSG